MDFDDFNGNFCNQGIYPLLTNIFNGLNTHEKPLGSSTQTPIETHTNIQNRSFITTTAKRTTTTTSFF